MARWFSREVMVSVAQRLLLESAVAGFIVLIATILSGITPLISIIAAIVSGAGFAVVRLAASCFLNPLNSPYLIRWPHPSGEIRPTRQSNVGSDTDRALTAIEFTARGAIDEWGGAITNVYTRASNQMIVLTSSDDDLIVLSGLADNRLVVTTKQLIPPHEQIVVNHCYESDVQALLENHNDLLGTLAEAGHQPMAMTLDHIIELLALEWDAWNQIGPFIGPFVSVGQRRPVGLLQVRVSSDEILERSMATPPRVTAASRKALNERPAAQTSTTTPPQTQTPGAAAPVLATAPIQDTTTAAVARVQNPTTAFTPATSFVPAATIAPTQTQQPLQKASITPPPLPPAVQQPATATPPQAPTPAAAPPIPGSSLERRPRRSTMQPSQRVAPAAHPEAQRPATEQAA